MNGAAAVLLILGKGLGIVLLLILLALAVFLVTPMGFRFAYRPGSVEVWAKFGPLRKRMYPRHARKPEPETAEPETPAPPAAEPAPQTEGKIPEKPEPKPDVTDRMIDAAGSDPGQTLHGLFRLLMSHGSRMLRRVKVRRLYVFWTVTGETAASTAILYGTEMAAWNTALAIARDHLRIHADRLWIEPDFTGQKTDQRRVSFEVLAPPVAVLTIGARLIIKILRDPTILDPGSDSTKTQETQS